MRRLLIPLLLLVASAGCYRFAGPLAVRQMDPADGRAPDGTRYSIYEQQQRGRARLSITEDDRAIGPNAYIDRPSPIGR